MDDNLVGFFNGSGISITSHNTQIFINTTTLSRTETVLPSVATIFLHIILFLSTATLILYIISTIKRQHPSIKASSPVMNHFIFTGCYIWTAASIVYIIVLKAIISEDERIYCANCCQSVFMWLLPVGWTMIFGTLIAKTWRIYKIFVHFCDPGCLISNRALVSFVLLQLGLDVALGICWSVLSPPQLQTVKTDISKTNPTIVTYLTQRSCVFLDDRINHLFWIITIVGYKALQVVVLLILTLLTKGIVNLRFSTLSLRKATYLSFFIYLAAAAIYSICGSSMQKFTSILFYFVRLSVVLSSYALCLYCCPLFFLYSRSESHSYYFTCSCHTRCFSQLKPCFISM